MPTCTLPYNGQCEVHLIVDVHGTKEEVDVLVDTGFTRGTGFGLKLPSDLAKYAKYSGTGWVTLANGESIPVGYIPDAKIIEIEGYRVDFITPMLFLDGPRVVGMLVLEKCVLHLDGPQRQATIQF